MCDENITITRFRELVDKEKSRDSMAKKMAERGLNCNTSTITKHYNGDRTISTEYVIKYAKYFGVSTDYLLGLSNVPTTETNIRMINEYTGLSNLSIKVLNVLNQVSTLNSDIYKNSYTDIINFLIEKIGGNYKFLQLFRSLTNYSFENKTEDLNIEEKILEVSEKTNINLVDLIFNRGSIVIGSEYRNLLQRDLEKLFSFLIDDLCTELNRQSYDKDYLFLESTTIEGLENILDSTKNSRKIREENRAKAQKSGDVSNGNNQKEKG